MAPKRFFCALQHFPFAPLGVSFEDVDMIEVVATHELIDGGRFHLFAQRPAVPWVRS